jgi:hypothetical protein
MRRDVNDALKHAGLGPHEVKSPSQLVMEKLYQANQRVFELAKATFKDKAPTKQEFANLIGDAFAFEMTKYFNNDERTFVLSSLLMEQAYKTIYD